jgi:cAMP-binding proteins - catabolite gene activator and regulatory subunit of cAMP-dependent protein kinases
MIEGKNKPNHSGFWANIFKVTSPVSDLEMTLSTMLPFMNLNHKELSSIIEIMHHRNYVSGEYIFIQNDPGIGLYIIQEGEVIIERVSEKGNKIVLADLSTGDFFGDLAMVDGKIRSGSAKAVTDCKLAVIFKPDLDGFIDKYPKIGIQILRGFSQIVSLRLRNLNQDYLSLLDQQNNS